MAEVIIPTLHLPQQGISSDTFYVLAARPAYGRRVECVAGPLSCLLQATGARARLVRLGVQEAVVISVVSVAIREPLPPLPRNTSVKRRMERAVEYMERNYQRRFYLADVARSCGMALSHFCVAFKAEHGITCGEYLTRYRLERAKKLLTNREVPIGMLAQSAGFDDPGYFTRLFRRAVGVTPTEYRAQVVNEDAPVPVVQGGDL